ncbi:MAG: hypothetical protein JWR37_5283 [Mycobacterium sp.]|nr:hypothetical protein [Mycobacterium sp.]
MDDEPTITPRIGTEVGDVMEFESPTATTSSLANTRTNPPMDMASCSNPFPPGGWSMANWCR